MVQGLSLDQMQQVHHVARLAVLAMCARGVAASEFESSPEVSEIVIRITRSEGGVFELPVDVEFCAMNGMPIGGMSV